MTSSRTPSPRLTRLLAWARAGGVLLVLALCATACAIGGATVTPVRLAKGDMLRYKRSGGLTGVTVRLTVTKRGHVTAEPNGRPFDLSRSDLSRLHRAIADADLGSLDSVNRPGDPVADGYEYTVSTRLRTVYAEDGAVPDKLQPLLGRLNGLVARAGLR